MDAHERDALGYRIFQINTELTYPKLSEAQAASLERERRMLARKLDDSGYRVAAPLTTEMAYVARN